MRNTTIENLDHSLVVASVVSVAILVYDFSTNLHRKTQLRFLVAFRFFHQK